MKRTKGTRQETFHFASLLLQACALIAQAVGVALPAAALLVGATAVGYAADLGMHAGRTAPPKILGQLQAEAVTRQALRDLLLVAGLLRLADGPSTGFLLLSLAGLLFAHGAHVLLQAGSVLVQRGRKLPVVTRNIDTSGLRLPPAPPFVITRRPGLRLLLAELPAVAGLSATAAGGHTGWALGGVCLTVALSLAGLLVLALAFLPGRRAPRPEAVMEWFDEWLRDYRPTVGMYFSGGSSSAYQANMWLPALERLEGRPVIVLRERAMVPRIGPTDLPIVCLPKVADLMRLGDTSLKVLLHPANAPKTSQVLRIPSIMHAFVNHGESDKLSSCNPYAKAYDEVWVAGPAARERYALAAVGVADEDVVEVGRPQLAGVERGSGPVPAGTPVTVLYAPTWEGWTDDPGNTSVILAGETIVRRLLADPGVRLLYRPHPLTGSVDPRAGAANRRITELIEEARGAGPRPGATPEQREALERTERELNRLTAAWSLTSADDLERMADKGRDGDVTVAEAMRRAADEWEAVHWAALPATEHQVLVKDRPGLYSCFNHADVLITDVSSVISEFMPSGKPYAVTNTTDLTEEAFRATFPTVRAGIVLTPTAKGLDELLGVARGTHDDTLVTAREELRAHLLGPAVPTSAERFQEAVHALAARVDERRAKTAADPAQAVPRQRAEAV
ncbi:hypothetical protein [Actinacidiphila sp. bgisy167]|uniref:hypothetical protein n=1 Tax=Actinacidiphila sp. bgisy167 TaxID=3413797 RepID=UPI003D74FDB9